MRSCELGDELGSPSLMLTKAHVHNWDEVTDVAEGSWRFIVVVYRSVPNVASKAAQASGGDMPEQLDRRKSRQMDHFDNCSWISEK